MLKTYLKSIFHQPFEYQALSSPRSIRVIALQNADQIPEGNTPIKLNIEERNLDSPGRFWALSYVCGDPKPVADVTLNGMFFPIGNNLNGALRCAWEQYAASLGGLLWSKREEEITEVDLGSWPCPLVLWVDAICISQQDAVEKSRQVTLMKEVFEKAESIICYLGPDDDDARLTFQKLSQMRSWYDRKAAELSFQGVNTSVITNMTPETAEFVEVTETGIDLRPWQAIGRFLTKTYFLRCWIIQESTTQQLTTYLCGSKAISSVSLEIAMIIFLGMMMNPGFQALEKVSGLEEVMRRSNIRNTRAKKPQDMTLLNAVEFLRRTKAANPRDKIYAAIGMATDFDPCAMVVDYRMPVPDVYIEFVLYQSSKQNNLDVLGYVGRSANPMQGLPTWAPDWTMFVRRTPFPKRLRGQDGHRRNVYHADAAIHMNGELIPFAIKNKKMHLRGIFVDRIARLGGPGSASLAENSGEASWAPEQPDKIYPPTGETTLKAFFRTLIGDVILRDADIISRASHIAWPLQLRGDDDLSKITAVSRSGSRAVSSMKSRTQMRCFAWTEGGYMGLVPSYAEKNSDEIWALAGGQVLYILRQTGRNAAERTPRVREFIGEAYIHGLMDGEVADLGKNTEEVVLE